LQLTCHMGSHSVTCHPAEATCLYPSQIKLVLDLPEMMQGCNDLAGCLHTKVVYPPSFIRRTTLTTTYTYIHIHTNLYSAKNRENESEAHATTPTKISPESGVPGYESVLRRNGLVLRVVLDCQANDWVLNPPPLRLLLLCMAMVIWTDVVHAPRTPFVSSCPAGTGTSLCRGGE